MSEQFLNERLCHYLFKMQSDPVPNIRFNIAKTIETIYGHLNNANKEKAKDLLNKFEADDDDFDVHFYAQKALKSINI